MSAPASTTASSSSWPAAPEERLYPLTQERAKPAVYFGGPYRIIDFACATASTPGCGASSSRRSTSRCRSTGTSAWAGASFRGARRVRRDSPAAEAGQRATGITRDRRRGVPEPVFDHAGEPPAPGSCSRAITSTRWTTRACCGCTMSGKRGYSSPPSRCRSPTEPFRDHRGDETERVHRLPGEAEAPDVDPRLVGPSRSPRWESTFLTPTCWSARSRPTPTSRPTTTSARNIIPALIHDAPVYSYRFYDENKKASK